MLNIFKKTTSICDNNDIPKLNNETSLLIKRFNDLNITIYGTYEDPLFKAKDIGELLGIKKIRNTIENLDDDCKVKINAPNGGVGNSDTWFLTEAGLYEVLFISRKPIAKQFKVWVRNIIKEIRLKGRYDLEEQIKIQELEYKEKLKKAEIEYQQQLQNTSKRLQEKEKELVKYKKLYEEIDKKQHVYVIQTDGGIKVGKTKDEVTKRVKGLQTANVNDIQILLDFETSNADILEKSVHYVLDRYRCNSNREFFDCDSEYIKLVVFIVGNTLDTLKSSFQDIKREDLFSKLNEKMGTNYNIKENPILVLDQSPLPANKFEKWLDKYIVEKKDNIVKLKTLCEKYLHKQFKELGHLPPTHTHLYKVQVENYIKKKFPNIKHEYRDTTFNGIRYRGWVGIALLDIDESESESEEETDYE